MVVVDNDRVCGLLTERDVVRLSAQQFPLDDLRICDVITPPVVTLYEADFTAWEIAFELLQRHHVRHLPLLDAENHLVGLVTQGTLQSLFSLQHNSDNEQKQQSLEVQQQTEECFQSSKQIASVDLSVRTQLTKHLEPDYIQSEITKKAVLAAIPDYLFCVDTQGIYREVVTYQQGMTLFPKELDPVGLSMTEVLPEEIAQQQLFYLQEALRSGELKTYEHQLQVNDQRRDEEVRVIQSGEDEVLFMVRDISDRKQAERQLQNLIEGTAATIGQDFFPALVRHLVAALGVVYAVVTELVDESLHTLAFCAGGTLQSSISYHPIQTPCERTLQEGRFFIDGLQPQDFPGDVDLAAMKVKSYLGIALYDSQNKAIGTLCILDHQPIPSPQRAEQILQVFGARAAAELERQRAIDSLEQLNQTLEVKVVERTVELQEREQFLQTVLDTFPLSVFWKDCCGVYLGCNRNFLQDVGLESVSDILGKTDFEMPWAQAKAEAYKVKDFQVMASNTPQLGIVETLVQADGKRIWLETNKLPLYNLVGDVVGVLGTHQDITTRKQLELDLQNSQKQLSEVLDTAIAGITRFRFYPDTSIQYDYISPHCYQNFGYGADELFPDAKLWQSRIHDDDWRINVLPTLQAILRTRCTSTHRIEYRFHRKDGSICWLLANCCVQWNEAGGYWYVTVVDTDISDRKTAESQLQNLILGTAAVGQDFFPALVRHIAEALKVSHVFAIECIDNEIRDLAAWANGELKPYDSIPLAHTPCERTVQAGVYHCEHSIQQQFPDCLALQAMEAESYLGLALRDTQGDIIGILHILDQKPLKNVKRAMQILQIFAARAAVELERQRANLALEKLNHALEVKVAERTAELQEREQFLQTVLDTFPLNVFWKDRNSMFLGANRNFLNNAGLASVADIKG